jgi:hypothetical protein
LATSDVGVGGVVLLVVDWCYVVVVGLGVGGDVVGFWVGDLGGVVDCLLFD